MGFKKFFANYTSDGELVCKIYKEFLKIWKSRKQLGTGNMVQWLKTYVIPTEDQGSVPRTHMMVQTIHLHTQGTHTFIQAKLS